MKWLAILRPIGASLLSILVVLLLLVAVELFSAIVHPFPADIEGPHEEICAHVARYPHWVLAAVVPMWGGIAWIGVWLAGRLGNRISSLTIAVLLLAAVTFNLSMLPYPLWFQLVQGVVVVFAVISGYRCCFLERKTTQHL